MPKFTLRGSMLGLVASAGLLLRQVHVLDMSGEGIDDRAYRIRNNAGQNFVDSVALAGAVGGK